MKKALSLILALVMVALMIPMAAFATSATTSDYLAYTDFTALTPEDGSDDDVNSDELAGAGWVVGKDVDAKWATTITPEYGVTIGANEGGMATTKTIDTIVGDTEDYIVEFVWSTHYKFANLEFGFGADASTADAIAFPSEFFQVGVGGGIGERSNGLNRRFKYAGTEWTNDQGVAITDNQGIGVVGDFGQKIISRDEINVSILVKGGKVTNVYFSTYGEVFMSFTAPTGSEPTASGYFAIRITGWGNNNIVDIEKFAVKAASSFDGAIIDTVSDVAAGEVYYHADFTQYAGLGADAMPFWTTEGATGEITGTANGVRFTNTGHIKNVMLGIPEEYLKDVPNFTMEYTLAAGVQARILFASFGIDVSEQETANYDETNSFKLRASSEGVQSDSFGWYDKKETGNWTWQDNKKYWPTDLSANILTDEVTVRIVVRDNIIVGVLVSAGDASTYLTPNGIRYAKYGDVTFGSNTSTATPADFTIKSVKFVEGCVKTGDLPASTAQNAPADKATLKVDGWMFTVDPGTYNLADWGGASAFAYEKNGVFTIATNVTVAAGDVVDVCEVDVYQSGNDLRLASNPGIRFKNYVDWNDMRDLIAAAEQGVVTGVEMGTLVTTKAHAAAAGAMTLEALETYQNTAGKTVYLNIEATEAYDGINIFAGSVIGVENFEREYVAVGYVTITTASGSVTLYSGEQTNTLKALAEVLYGNTSKFDALSADEKAAVEYIAGIVAE